MSCVPSLSSSGACVMYGLPANEDFRFIQGKSLIQVCIGYNEVILRLDDRLSILIQSDMGHVSSTGELTAVYETSIPAAPMLTALLHLTVDKVMASPPGTLSLTFSNGETLELYDSSPHYESYVITYGDKTIVV